MERLKSFFYKFSARKQFNTEDEYRRAMKEATVDGITICIRAILAIITFEIIMITTVLVGGMFSKQHLLYLAGYVFLLVTSIIILSLLLYTKKDVDKRYHILQIFDFPYDICLLVWAVYMTAIDNIYSENFTILIFITILVIIPIVNFLKPIEYTVLHLTGCISVVLIIIFIPKSDVFANMLNFIVFAITSYLSGISFYAIRIKSYKRQIDLSEYANRDALSGLYNRQKLGTISNTIWEDCVNADDVLSCILADIDDFKVINDKYGHLSGDKWIAKISDIIKNSKTDGSELFFRYGGEEFLILLPGKTSEEACKIVESIQKKLTEICVNNEEGINVTLSFGIYTGTPKNSKENIEKYFSHADELLYDAKHNGKDRYSVSIESYETEKLHK